jgi:hypothetical protein
VHRRLDTDLERRCAACESSAQALEQRLFAGPTTEEPTLSCGRRAFSGALQTGLLRRREHPSCEPLEIESVPRKLDIDAYRSVDAGGDQQPTPGMAEVEVQRRAILRHQPRFAVVRDLEFERVWLPLQTLREDPAQQTPRGEVAAAGDGVGDARRARGFVRAGRPDGLAFGCTEVVEACQPKIHADPCG